MNPFHQTILLWRLKRGYTQAELAHKAGIPRPNLSAIENGKKEVTLKTIRALALALNIKPGLLVDGIGPEELKPQNQWSRKKMERIAAAVANNKKLNDSKEQAWAQKIRLVMASQLKIATHSQKKHRLTRAADRAWLELSQIPKTTLYSCIARAREHAERQ